MGRLRALEAAFVVAATGSGAAAAPQAASPAQVVHAWSAALNANRNETAARLFARREGVRADRVQRGAPLRRRR